MKNTKLAVFVLIGFLIAAWSGGGWGWAQAPLETAAAKSEIRGRKDFDLYLKKFNSRDYPGFLSYFAGKFEMIHVGGNLKSREDVMKFYKFLHHYIKETVMVDRLVMDEHMIAMEARVQIEGVRELTPQAVAASGYPRLKPLKVGEKAVIPQFIHYHVVNGKIVKVECRE